MEKTSMDKFSRISTKILLFLIGVIAIVGFYKFMTKPIDRSGEITVGDVYIYMYGEDNPFKGPYIKYHRVLDVKNNYVLFVDTVTGDTSSLTVGSFLIDSEKLTN